MIFPNSRYRNAITRRVALHDGTFQTAIFPLSEYGSTVVEVSPYAAVEGDRFDLISLRIYNDPTWWWYIAYLNPGVYYPDEIPPGTILRIPNG